MQQESYEAYTGIVNLSQKRNDESLSQLTILENTSTFAGNFDSSIFSLYANDFLRSKHKTVLFHFYFHCFLRFANCLAIGHQQIYLWLSGNHSLCEF